MVHGYELFEKLVLEIVVFKKCKMNYLRLNVLFSALSHSDRGQQGMAEDSYKMAELWSPAVVFKMDKVFFLNFVRKCLF